MELSRVCRTCLSERNELSSLFNNSLDTALSGLTQIAISRDDGLPGFICNNCVFTLNLSVNFKEQCQKNDAHLRKTLLHNKVEVYEEYKTVTVVGDGNISTFIELPAAERKVIKVEVRADVKQEKSLEEECPDVSEADDEDHFFEEENEDEPEEEIKPQLEKDEAEALLWKCKECNKVFQQEASLKSHQTRHGLVLKCEVCGKDFNTTIDTWSGIGENDNHLCENCGYLVTPKATKRKIRNEKNWRRNIMKEKRLKGEEYELRRTGTKRPKRELKAYDHKCRYSCSKISERHRQQMFDQFYAMGSYNAQTAFIASCVKKSAPARRRSHVNAKKRNKGKSYVTVITLQEHRVCREFFLRTLDITGKRFNSACDKIKEDGEVEPDMRGRRTPTNKIGNHVKESVRDHINSFERLEGHHVRCCQRNLLKGQYLTSELNIRAMHRHYVKDCEEKNVKPVTEPCYRKLFKTEFNLQFHKCEVL